MADLRRTVSVKPFFLPNLDFNTCPRHFLQTTLSCTKTAGPLRLLEAPCRSESTACPTAGQNSLFTSTTATGNPQLAPPPLRLILRPASLKSRPSFSSPPSPSFLCATPLLRHPFPISLLLGRATRRLPGPFETVDLCPSFARPVLCTPRCSRRSDPAPAMPTS